MCNYFGIWFLRNFSILILISISFFFSVGLYVAGKIVVNAGFVTLDLNFNLEKEPKLNLNTDVDFSSENLLCMQLSQPNDVLRYVLLQIELKNTLSVYFF